VPDLALAAVLQILQRAYPREGCGVLLQGPSGTRAVELPNALGPLAGRHGFAFDDRAWLAVLLEAEAQGERVTHLFHSHPDAPAEFSAQDARAAAPGGIPLFPGVSHLVVSLSGCGPLEARLFAWSGTFFSEVARLEIPSGTKTSAETGTWKASGRL
jgi:proteasome lid subunit RPN8/RPN11